MPKSIDEILNDPQLNEILDRLETNKKSKKVLNVNPDIKKFMEIVEWVKENGHEPVAAEYGSNERKLYSRLKGIRKRHSNDELAEYEVSLFTLINSLTNSYVLLFPPGYLNGVVVAIYITSIRL